MDKNDDETSECVLSLLENEESLRTSAIDMILKIADNILQDPGSVKFRSISLNSGAIEQKLLPAIGALEVLFLMGFEEADDRLLFPRDASLETLRRYRNMVFRLQGVLTEKECTTKDTSGGKKLKLKPRLDTLPVTPDLLESESQLLSKINAARNHVMVYEKASLQQKVRDIMPLNTLNGKARQKLERVNLHLSSSDKPMDLQDCLLMEILDWFKGSFFSWFDTPVCPQCKVALNSVGNLPATEDDLRWGAGHAEGYKCTKCEHLVRFPRYNNPEKLLETRTGRCGEWANCFTLMCRAVGMDARHIVDFTDHVWTEVFSQSQNRWLHCDPCENCLDTPLMYEVGWGKKLSYVLAYSKDEIVDVTWRYTASQADVMTRRLKCRETWLIETIANLNVIHQATFAEAKRKFLRFRLVCEVAQFMSPVHSVKEGENQGRISGSLSWRVSRGEVGDEKVCGKVFELTPIEMRCKEFVLKYSAAADLYVRVSNGEEKLIGWAGGVAEACRICRKQEADWNMVYLARQGSETGEIKWVVEWPLSSLHARNVLVVLQHSVFENGCLDWSVCVGDVCHAGNKEGVLELSQLQLIGCTKLEISVILSKGVGVNAWQHVQLFRQRNDATEQFPFFVHIKFE